LKRATEVALLPCLFAHRLPVAARILPDVNAYARGEHHGQAEGQGPGNEKIIKNHR
jgi:hypothetical protein